MVAYIWGYRVSSKPHSVAAMTDGVVDNRLTQNSFKGDVQLLNDALWRVGDRTIVRSTRVAGCGQYDDASF